MSSALTLYDLTSNDLAQMVALRSEMEQNGEATADIDAQIAAYVENLPTKIDAVAHVLRMLRNQSELANEEISRLVSRRSRFNSAYERLEQYVKACLMQLPAPKKGSRKLEGEHTTLALRNNGGVQPLEITDPNMIPDSLCFANIRMNYSDWLKVVNNCGNLPVRKVEREPDNKCIREALEQPCWICGGENADGCVGCGGSGKNGVPGASLGPRGQSLRIE